MTILSLENMAESFPKDRKQYGKRKNCLIRTIFFFFHSVFKGFVLQTGKNQGLFGKGLISDTELDFKTLKCAELFGAIPVPYVAVYKLSMTVLVVFCIF